MLAHALAGRSLRDMTGLELNRTRAMVYGLSDAEVALGFESPPVQMASY